MDSGLSQGVPTTPITSPAIVTAEPFSEGPSTFFETGGPSIPPGFSPPGADHEEAYIRLAQFLAQEQTGVTASKAKGIVFNEGQSRDEDFVINELQKRVNVLDQKNNELSIQVEDLLSENINLKIQVSDLKEDGATKTKQISTLQAHFNLLTSSYFDLKKKLE